MKKFALVFLLIVATPVMSQDRDNKFYLFGGLGSFGTQTVDTHTIWHVGAGVQLSKRFGFELDLWPGTYGKDANVDDIDVLHNSLYVTFRSRLHVQSPDIRFVLKGGVSEWKSTNHKDLGISKIHRGALSAGAGVIVNPEDKLSFEFSAYRVFDKFEFSDTFRATMRFRF
ncbi:MAG: porin family protein [Gammaproteobacteria bacterium]|nr:porin family protein [Gammaproteobacteria bacterium]